MITGAAPEPSSAVDEPGATLWTANPAEAFESWLAENYNYAPFTAKLYGGLWRRFLEMLACENATLANVSASAIATFLRNLPGKHTPTSATRSGARPGNAAALSGVSRESLRRTSVYRRTARRPVTGTFRGVPNAASEAAAGTPASTGTEDRSLVARSTHTKIGGRSAMARWCVCCWGPDLRRRRLWSFKLNGLSGKRISRS